ncbi:unnamed protein product [Effrenium voratum]|nr:unnamed protein product [Effrenium voratum]
MEWSGPRSYRSLLEALRQEEELERQLEQAESAELRAQIFSEAHAQAAAEESAAALEMYLQAARDKAADAWAKHEEPLQRAAVQLARARRGAAVLEEEHADRWQQQEKLLWLQQEVAQMDLHDKGHQAQHQLLTKKAAQQEELVAELRLQHEHHEGTLTDAQSAACQQEAELTKLEQMVSSYTFQVTAAGTQLEQVASEIFSLSEHHDREVAVMQQELQLRDEELEAVSREVLALRAEAMRTESTQLLRQFQDVPSGVHALGEQCAQCWPQLGLGHRILAFPQDGHVAQESMPALSVEYIKHASGEFDEESVFQAILSNRSISKIEQLSKCCNLRWLDLSKNQIMRMENLEGLGQLVSVDLSFNKILKVGDLSGAPILERLMLKANPISKLQDLEGLKTARALRHLAFQNVDTSDSCPVCSTPEYQRTVQQHCKDLVALDSKRFALPDLDREIRRLDEQTAIDVPDPEPWFTQADLDLGELPSPEELEETLKDPIQDFQAAMAECKQVFREAEELLRLQEAS